MKRAGVLLKYLFNWLTTRFKCCKIKLFTSCKQRYINNSSCSLSVISKFLVGYSIVVNRCSTTWLLSLKWLLVFNELIICSYWLQRPAYPLFFIEFVFYSRQCLLLYFLKDILFPSCLVLKFSCSLSLQQFKISYYQFFSFKTMLI